MRALISYVPGNDDAESLRSCAANAYECLSKENGWCVSEPIDNSSAEHFLSSARESIDDFRLTIHIAHGNTCVFKVSERVQGLGNGLVSVKVSEIAGGKRHARYLWFVACNVLAHGPDNYREPHKFNSFHFGRSPVREANFFARWGRRNGQGGLPLGHGLRMVCGGSTTINPSQALFFPIFRLTRQGFMLADSFILGLVNESQTPLCATLATEDWKENPLYDCEWSRKRNSGGDRLYIQYPIRGERWAAGIPQTRTAPLPLPKEYKPIQLPILEAHIDDEMQSLFAEIEQEIGTSGAIRAEHRRDDGTLLVFTGDGDDNPSPKSMSRLARLVSSINAGKLRVDSCRLIADGNHSRVTLQQIDSFPVDQLPTDDKNPFPRCSVASREKCRYLATVGRLRDRSHRGAVYETLDPDLRLLLRYEADTDGGFGLPTRGLRLLIRGWTFKDWSSEAGFRALKVEEATEKARAAAGSDSEDAPRLDTNKPILAIGYRLYSGDGKPGFLMPHYLVTFPYRREVQYLEGPAPPPDGGVTVEIPVLARGSE